jgi:hypothetical protein
LRNYFLKRRVHAGGGGEKDLNTSIKPNDTVDEWDLKRNVNLVFKRYNEGIPNCKAKKYLINLKGKYDKFIMNTPPLRPLAGQVFLYKPIQPLSKISISDQYRWHSSDTRTIDEENQIKKQRYYSKPFGDDRSNKDFLRFIYYSIEQKLEERLYLISYVGNEKVYKDGPHKNRKHDLERNFTSSSINLLSSITNTNIQPNVLYKKKLAEENLKLREMGENFTLAYERTNLPRDKKQMENKLYNLRKDKKISRDFIYNLYEIGLNLEPFILEMKLLPELEVIMSNFFEN